MGTLGSRIRHIRVAILNINQRELAEYLCCDQASISIWEKDKGVPAGPSLVALACLLGVTVEYLETGVGTLPAEYVTRFNNGPIPAPHGVLTCPEFLAAFDRIDAAKKETKV